MKAILKYPRKDPATGLFDDKENFHVFFPILKDMYPSENFELNDFLLTCEKDFVQLYRQPILQFIGPQNIKKHGQELQNIAEDTVRFWEEKSKERTVNATELSFVFSITVISKLLLGHPGPFEAYKEIAYGIDCLNKHMLKMVWKQPISSQEKQKYTQSLEIVKKAIAISLANLEKPHLGSLVDVLREKEMSDLQIKSTLFLMYFAGSETTASLLNYLLWQLGKHPEYQEEIVEEMKTKEGSLFDSAMSLQTVDKLFAECIRLFTPGYVMGRQPATDLIFTVKNKQGDLVFKEEIGKNVGILSFPTFAGRDPNLYKNPDVFMPHRFETSPKTFPWLPFGDGKHACPGQWLAKAEIAILVTVLVRNFKIESWPDQEPEQKGYITLKSKEDVWLTLSKR